MRQAEGFAGASVSGNWLRSISFRVRIPCQIPCPDNLLENRLAATRDLASTPDRSRTCDLRFRKPSLYPTELREQIADLPMFFAVFGEQVVRPFFGLTTVNEPKFSIR